MKTVYLLMIIFLVFVVMGVIVGVLVSKYDSESKTTISEEPSSKVETPKTSSGTTTSGTTTTSSETTTTTSGTTSSPTTGGMSTTGGTSTTSSPTTTGTSTTTTVAPKTVKQRLMATCPKDLNAGDMISAGNQATYNDWLFSACTSAGTCAALGLADEISDRIINMDKTKETCGTWDLSKDPNKLKIIYTNETKWTTNLEPQIFKTVRQRLKETCPLDLNARYRISPGNLASYDDYLFSACTSAGTCDSLVQPDPISDRIINMDKTKETCGDWDLSKDPNKLKIIYTNETKWTTNLEPQVSKTVRQRLMETCPKDPTAGDKISPGNNASYDDYLFSACTSAGTCDSQGKPDPISDRIINMDKTKEHCGSWVLASVPDKIQISYNNQTKWVAKTVRQRLMETCPKDPTANGMISPGNLATYDNWLFSNCTLYDTCESFGKADDFSNRIITMDKTKEKCGDWDLSKDPNKVRMVFNPNYGIWTLPPTS